MSPPTTLSVLAAREALPFTLIARRKALPQGRSMHPRRYGGNGCQEHRGYLADSHPVSSCTCCAEVLLPCGECWEVWLLSPAAGARQILCEIPPSRRGHQVTIDLRWPMLQGRH